MRILFRLTAVLLILSGCTNIDRPVEKSRLEANDYRLFQGTEVWPLVKAAKKRDFKRVNQLLDDNPELANIKDSIYCNTLLMLAIYHQDYKLFRALLDHNPNVNYHNTYNGYSPLIEACKGLIPIWFIKGYDRIYAKDLVEYGANVNDTSQCSSSRHITPLMAAANSGDNVMVKYLLEKGANINYNNYYSDKYSRTVLGEALRFDNYETALLLLENGANYTVPVSVDIDDNDTITTSILHELRLMTPTRFTPDFRRKKKIIKFLKERGLDYDTEPIPEYIIEDVKNDYPFTWKSYLRDY